ncbi:MAG: ImmA/IrrE family metallo-endopeptidase, partial [Candidatus Brocadiaceae bacterium]|nr:ImmA/IrrE family metallo-endopeptidase [Candidatus Brocadiaceae bacterium]
GRDEGRQRTLIMNALAAAPGIRMVIAVDEDVFSHSNPVRYRFTLAHEIGHLILHPQLYRLSNIRDINSWKNFVKALPDTIYKRAEYQAYCFAGLVLVPHRPLKLEVEGAINFIKQNMKKLPNNITAHANSDFWQTTVEEMVAIDFEVSSQVISRRIKFDKLDELVLEI